MTQGEEHRHSASSGEFRRNLELSHPSDREGPAPKEAAAAAPNHKAAEVFLPASHRPASQQVHGGEDPRNLLQFVHHASCDIKAALDQGNYLHRHRRQLSPSAMHSEINVSGQDVLLRTNPSPIRRFSPESMLAHHFKRHHHHPHHHHHVEGDLQASHNRENTSSGDLTENRTEVPLPRNSRDIIFSQRQESHLPFPETVMAYHSKLEEGLKGVNLSKKDEKEDEKRHSSEIQSKEERESRPTESRNLDLFRYVDSLRESNQHKESGEPEQSDCDSNNGNETVDSKEAGDERKEMKMDDAIEKCDDSKINSVPLRKRRLPASFWQEPKGKSENHKVRPVDPNLEGQPRSFVHHPGLSLFGQLKLPLPSPLSTGRFDFDFGVGRHFGVEKNPFIYPSTSMASPFLNLNLQYRPHLSLPVPHSIDQRHRHGIPVPCGNSICMCHLQNLAGCPSHVCEPSSPSAPGIFGRGPTIPSISPLDAAPSPALALSRWSAMQSSLTGGDGAADILSGYPMPRVLKPIPTKSMTSYPPRFHPIFT